MPAIQKSDSLTEALQRLEQRLELPYISGDLKAWADEVLTELKEVENLTAETIEAEHPSAFKTIVKSQRNLQQQVEKLQQEDQQLLPAFHTVRQQAEQFSGSIDETALAGQQFQERRERLVNEGLSLVLRIRRQRAAIDTWLGEAMQRDNGVGD